MQHSQMQGRNSKPVSVDPSMESVLGFYLTFLMLKSSKHSDDFVLQQFPSLIMLMFEWRWKKRNWSQTLGKHLNEIFVPPCCSMSDSEDLLISTDTQEPAGHGVCSPPAPSPPPPYSNQELLPPPPPYSAAPPRYDPAKVATDSSSLSSTGYESFMDLRLETPSDTTPLMCSSAFDDKTVRRGFIRKVCATVSLKHAHNEVWTAAPVEFLEVCHTLFFFTMHFVLLQHFLYKIYKFDKTIKAVP